jgi:hypothetical protein
MDRSTTGRMSGVSLRLDLFTSPVSPYGAAGDAAYGLDAGFPASNPWHRFTLTRLPEPSVLVPFGTGLTGSSWGGPRSVGSSPRLRCPHAASARTEVHPELTCPRRPKATDHPAPGGVGCARSSRRTVRSSSGCPVPHERSSRSPSPGPPEGDHRTGLTRRRPGLPRRTPTRRCPRASRRSPAARCEVAVNTVRAPNPLRSMTGVGWAEAPSSPLLERALSGTRISKDAAKPQVKRYFRIHRVIPETFSLPPGFRSSSTRCPPFMHNDVHNSTCSSDVVGADGRRVVIASDGPSGFNGGR